MRAEEFQTEINKDIEKISKFNIEAASRRGGSIADSKLELKKLSARTAERPLALEAARMTEEIRKEL